MSSTNIHCNTIELTKVLGHVYWISDFFSEFHELCSSHAIAVISYVSSTVKRQFPFLFFSIILYSGWNFGSRNFIRVISSHILRKFRGSSSAICISAFGTFLSLGGALMLLLAHFSMDDSPLFNLEYYYQKPIQLAGSIFLVFGGILVLASLLCIVLSVKVCSRNCFSSFQFMFCL